MEKREAILFLAHRIPYPPNKGDKVRSYHLFRHLASRYRVFLGTFVDDPADHEHLPAVRDLCEDACFIDLDPRQARLRSASGLLRGEPLTLPYYRSERLHDWVRETAARHGVRKAVVFSSAMAQYVAGIDGLETIVDFVDVDSDKWRQYAQNRLWPMSMIYRREAERLLRFERDVAATARYSIFSTEAEADFFRRLAPESADRVIGLCNGVDTAYFAPNDALPCPFEAGEVPIVFTGAMDYWPNIDAVCWYATEIFPIVKAHVRDARFYVVGMNPTPAVRALGDDPSIVVTGRVPDVRPYLQHARSCVAPLRVARGIQNKVLEAMAMGRPVVTTAACGAVLKATPGREIELAATVDEFACKTLITLEPYHGRTMGKAARERVLADYGWEPTLERLDAMIQDRALRKVEQAVSG